MARQERSKKSTISNQVETFKSANDLPEPTEPLNERELTYFNRVVKSRELSTWSDNDLSIATSLALTYVQYFECVEDIKINGRTVITDKGAMSGNPVASQMSQLSAAIRSFSATLGLSAGQRSISGGKQDGRNKAEQAARGVIERVAADDLLA